MGEISIYDPRTMGKLIVRMPKVRTFIRDTFFRNVQTFDTKKIDVDMKKGNRQLAPFVHPKMGSETIPNSGYQTSTYEPPLVAPDKITTIDDILARRPGESLYNGKSPKQRAVEKMQEDFAELDETITRREEWMCCQTLFTGKIPVIGKGLDYEIDFDFTNRETLSGTKQWGKSAADPLGDIGRWKERVQKTGYVNTDICLMGKAACAAFLKDENVQKLLDNRRYDLAVIKPRELPNGATYIGTLAKDNIDIYTYCEWFLDDWTNKDKPEEKPLVPDNMVAMLSTEAIYSMYYGGVPVVDERGKEIGVAEGTRIPDQWVERKPPRRFLGLSAAPLPVPHEVDAWFTAYVM
ncbi:MAG: major capsid protein [Lachnospiraceae bacterium]|nr:major capsid protein [Lachnospiraceae bacterium]MCM1240448.1 major capsid protein [Lachnospiraceae bacterium]